MKKRNTNIGNAVAFRPVPKTDYNTFSNGNDGGYIWVG